MDTCTFRDTVKSLFHLPAWGIMPDGRICFMNEAAERLLGVKATDAIGHPCHTIVKGRGANELGASWSCSSRCGEADPQSDCRLAIKLFRIEMPNGEPKWIQVMPVLKTTSDNQACIVETAVEVNHWMRIEQYVRGLARRGATAGGVDVSQLTAREQEVLTLLAEGLSQHCITKRLGVSYATVRTHVQRILSKVGASSIEGAVAGSLLEP